MLLMFFYVNNFVAILSVHMHRLVVGIVVI